jgi:hypothetical protein
MIVRGALLPVPFVADIDSSKKQPRLLLSNFKKFAGRLRWGYVRAKFRYYIEIWAGNLNTN